MQILLKRSSLFIAMALLTTMATAQELQEHFRLKLLPEKPEESTQGFFFSTEEDFVTRGPEPADGNSIIADGDVLQFGNGIIINNYDLVGVFEPKTEMLGLDALSAIIKLDVD